MSNVYLPFCSTFVTSLSVCRRWVETHKTAIPTKSETISAVSVQNSLLPPTPHSSSISIS
ncbi:hypothetical protein HMPREF9999_00436 [Alloprevotella sp. oral taxon 473 str. F0040]|nr:hypothetical protein HMPREF9999_00436 [Alloprevotella sp. oral taxon 473 str. F0040]